MAKKPAATAMHTWAISRIKGTPAVEIGRVEAPDAECQAFRGGKPSDPHHLRAMHATSARRQGQRRICGPALPDPSPTGAPRGHQTFAHVYASNRGAAIEDAIDADPVAACVRELMAERSSWAGRAVDLLRVGADRIRHDAIAGGPDWPNNPRALAGRLRRTQTFLRAVGIDISFSREGRTGSRVIRIIRRSKTPSERSAASATTGNDPDQYNPRRDRPVSSSTTGPPGSSPGPTGHRSVSVADDADGADANAGFGFG
jgi:hypothetical protein